MNSLLSDDVGSKDGASDGILKEEDNDDCNKDGTDGNADDDANDCIGGADDEDDIFISLVDVDNRSDDNGYSIGILLVWVERWEGWRKEFECACWSLSNNDDSDDNEGSSDVVDDDSFRLGFSVELVTIVIVVVVEAFIKGIIMIMIIIVISIWPINNSNNL